MPLSEPLAVAGFVFDQLAGVVNTRATLLLEAWESCEEEGDGLGSGLSDVLASVGGHEAVVNLEPAESATEADVMATIKALSHGENIPLWSSQVSEAMRLLTQKQRRKVKSMSLLALQQSLQVPLVKVWLGLLLGDSGYQLARPVSEELDDFHAWSEAFYSGASLQVVAVP